MKQLTQFFTTLCEKYLPDAFGFCLILTLLVFAAACVFTPHAPLALVQFWGDSLWTLNNFAFQMAIVLITGHMLAEAPFFARRLNQLSRLPSTHGQALVLLSVVSLLACWLNWGFGLILAGLFSRALAQRFTDLSFGTILATGYAGFIVWHGGLSGSIPLSIAGGDKVLQGLSLSPIALSETIFSPMNLTISLLMLILVPLTAYGLRATGSVTKVQIHSDHPVTVTRGEGFKGWIEHSRVPLFMLILLGSVYFFQAIAQGKVFDLNMVNLAFLVLASVFLGSVSRFINALEHAIQNVAGILIQYPLYAGVMGIMQSSGLGDQLSQFFVDIATPQTFPYFAFLSAGVVNFFVPSGGGQWVVQGPVLLKAAMKLGVSLPKTALAVAWGDGSTNMLQPFWALPLLSLAKLQLKDIMGPCVIYLLVSSMVVILGLSLF